jgi:Cd2+/Zn2+-exporting ATPase/Cu+-exporting ATPase
MKPEARIEIGIEGMDCAECTRHVQKALISVPGVAQADVYLASEKAVLELETSRVDMLSIERAVTGAGYSVVDSDRGGPIEGLETDLSRKVGRLTAVVFVAVLLIVVGGELFGLIDLLTEYIPMPIGALVVLAAGYPIFRNVIRATRNRQVTAHTLMTLGVLAALIAGQWVTALLVVFFMRVGDYIEHYTAEQARQAVRQLSRMVPRTARVLRNDEELEIPIAEVEIGDTIVVRPGETIPVDGDVIDGQATVDQSAITGEAMPLEVGPGSRVYAATSALLGSVRVRASHIGSETTFGHILTLVEEAENNRGEVQRFADKFTSYYLPVVATIALLTLIIRRDPMATVAVLVVACSCAIALATPVAMLASIGSAAKKGLMIKGGKYIELLDQADVLLIDKTGTLTLGRPRVCDVIPLNGLDEEGLLILAASAEKYSEHPVAQAVRTAAKERGLPLFEPASFAALPGLGIRAQVDGKHVTIGSQRLVGANSFPEASQLEEQGKTLLYIAEGDLVSGILAVTDTLRQEVPQALDQVRKMGIERIELLTGDNKRSAAALANQLGLDYQAELLPDEKIAVVKSYQQLGHKVVMIGDGVNDAPALAQADVGIAMGVAGSDVALEAAHVALMRDDWNLVPELFHLSHRTMRVVKLNLGFTAVYNVIGISLAAVGILPPVMAAAAQSIPDLGILANSSRLLRD